MVTFTAKARARVRRPDVSGGFTLIELLIVIVILGVLAGIAIFAVNAFKDDAQAVACGQDRHVIETAIHAYEVQNHVSPASLLDLTASDRYLRADPAITASSKTGEGYTLVYSAGQLSACGAAPSGGSAPPSPPAPPTLAAPTNVAATLQFNNKVDASWQQAAGVTYECTVDTSATPPAAAGAPCASPYTDNGHNNMTRFWIRAVNAAGETSPWVGINMDLI